MATLAAGFEYRHASGQSSLRLSTINASPNLGSGNAINSPEALETKQEPLQALCGDGARRVATDARVAISPAKTKQDGVADNIFSGRQKWRIVYLVSLAGSFSPLSSNIYFPAIADISESLGVSASQVLLTVTVYMVAQGLAPSLFGTLSDIVGRRITFIATLTIYTAANLALAFTANFPMLLVLRAVQAAGSSATISISTGVIADIAKPGERGRFMGTNAGTRMIAQAIGPIIGGALNSAWGFRSIFWFLFCLSGLTLTLLLTFLPETQRGIAGNGGTPVHGLHKPWVYMLWPPKEWMDKMPTSRSPDSPKQLRSNYGRRILSPLRHVFKKDIAVLLVWGALVYTIWSMVTSSTTTVLLKTFPSLTQWQVGLCFLPNGAGCVLGSISTGYFLDRIFKRVETQYKSETGIETLNTKACKDFPFERARLLLMPYYSIAFIISIALYGPSYEFNDLHRYFGANLAASLGLQFLIAFMATAIFNINSTLLVDCFPESSAGATATNNLFRCLIGAAGVSSIQPLIDACKIMNSFLILTGVVVLFSPLIWVQWKYGGKWRRNRQAI